MAQRYKILDVEVVKVKARTAWVDGQSPIEKVRVDRLLIEAEAARVLRVAPGTLKDWRKKQRQSGPPYMKIGVRRIVYSLRALNLWLKRQTREGASAQQRRERK